MTTLRITFTAITFMLASSGNSLTASQAQSSSQSSAQPVKLLFSEGQTNVTVVNATRAELAATAQTTALATVAATTTPYTGGSTSSASAGSSRSISSGSQMSEQERKQIALYLALARHRSEIKGGAMLPDGQLAVSPEFAEGYTTFVILPNGQLVYRSRDGKLLRSGNKN